LGMGYLANSWTCADLLRSVNWNF